MQDSGFALPGTIVRNLSDRLYDKRKTAALEIEQMMKDMLSNGDDDGINSIMTVLITDFAQNPVSNYRKGGLIGALPPRLPSRAGPCSPLAPHEHLRLFQLSSVPNLRK